MATKYIVETVITTKDATTKNALKQAVEDALLTGLPAWEHPYLGTNVVKVAVRKIDLD